ncbi:hypothetical protein [Hyphomonas sp.]|uniref:hypothetical protein n=1 Tax=Hyphomonas sp. TaxID=87 RepID=UPI002622D205|nr:hypothetical protein [Hyphomonas sp.]MDF1807998.1 hypothetical protein [Hyphomonas sp.]
MPRFVLVVCGVWTVFTLINLFHPPPIVIQLGVIWGSFYLWRKRAKRAAGKHNQVLALSYQPDGVRAGARGPGGPKAGPEWQGAQYLLPQCTEKRDVAVDHRFWLDECGRSR